MKTTLKLLTLSVALFAFANISFGQNFGQNVTADAAARIITPIKIQQDQALEFGDIISGTNVVTIAPDGIRTATDPTLLLTLTALTAGGRTPQAAQFSVEGEKNLSYTVNIDESATLTRAGGGGTMTIDNFQHNSTGTLDTSGKDTFNVGADLTVSANQASGVYEGTYTVTVAYQ